MSTSHRVPYLPSQITLPFHKRNSSIKTADPCSTYHERKPRPVWSQEGATCASLEDAPSPPPPSHTVECVKRQQEDSEIYFRHRAQRQQRITHKKKPQPDLLNDRSSSFAQGGRFRRKPVPRCRAESREAQPRSRAGTLKFPP